MASKKILVGMACLLAVTPLAAASSTPVGNPIGWLLGGTLNDELGLLGNPKGVIIGVIICGGSNEKWDTSDPVEEQVDDIVNDVDIGGVCDLDCSGSATVCTITVSDNVGLGGPHKFSACIDGNKDNLCQGPENFPAIGKFTTSGQVPKVAGATTAVQVFISLPQVLDAPLSGVGGGFVSAVDP